MPKHQKTKSTKIYLRVSATAALVGAGVYVLAHNWHTVSQSLHVARQAQVGYFLLALACTALTYALAAAIYNTLALHSLRYRQTLLIELSTAFVNRLLPSGIGGLGIHGLYLYKRKHTPAQATAIVSTNNLLGITAHLLLLGAAVLRWPTVLDRLSDHFHAELPAWFMVVFIVLGLVVCMTRELRRRIRSFVRNLLTSLHKIGGQKAGKTLLIALSLTATYTAVLWLCTRALGMQFGLVETFVVFSVGMLFGTASPTPGGLVGAEAGLFAGFVGYGVASSTAGAAVVLYRLATYWIPLVPGFVALSVARTRALL